MEKKAKLHAEQDAVIPNAKLIPGLDQYYALYRMGILMASAPGEPQIPPAAAIEDHPFFIPYTEEDARIIDLTRKLCGYPKPSQVSHGVSHEPDGNNITSPINTKANKRK